MDLRCIAFDTSRTDLTPLPIEPAWVKAGAPFARAIKLSESPDSLLTAGLWDCTAGTFTWIFGTDEIVHILEGEVRVREGNTTHVLGPGSLAYFPRGLETVWEVPQYVKKSYIHRVAQPPQRSLFRRAASRGTARLVAVVRRT